MPPCIDVYVWLPPQDAAAALRRFLQDYVDTRDPGDARLAAVERVHAQGEPQPGDRTVLADLSRTGEDDGVFTIYVRARDHDGASVTVTREGAVVLGLAVDDPLNLPGPRAEAIELAAELRAAFDAPAALVGTELPPPQDHAEWLDDALVVHRSGRID